MSTLPSVSTILNFQYLQDHYEKSLDFVIVQQEMFAAAEKGDNVEKIKEYIRKGADVRSRSINEWSGLHYAAKGNNVETVKFFLEQNLSIDGEDVQGRKPLHIAALSGSQKVLTWYIGEGIIDINNYFGYQEKTLLHYAAENGHKEVVEILLNNNAEINAKTTDKGLTPLHVAAQNGHLDVVNALLDKGADFNAKTIDKGLTPLHSATLNGYLDVVKALLDKGADFNAKAKDGWTSLHVAAQNGHLDVVKALLDKGADFNAKNKDDFTPLHSAAENGHLDVVKALLDKGADFNAKATDDWTPLHYAAKNGHSGIVQLLLEKGAHYNVKDSKGRSPLYLAKSDDIKKLLSLIDNLFIQVKEGDPQNVEDYIKKGVVVNAKDKDGWTSLHYAVQNNRNEVVGVLLNNKADVNAKTTDKGNTPLHIAVSKGNDGIVKILLQHASKLNVIKFNDFINAQTTIKGTTALHLAAEKGNLHVVKLLLENGAVVNIKNSVGDTPLQVAEPQSEVGKLLNIIDKLFQAVQDEKEDEVRSLLQEKNQNDGLKAILNARNTDNKTLLQVASVNKQRRDIADFLLNKLKVARFPNQQEEATHQEGEISAKECLPSTSHRKKREAENECLFTWEDVDEFNVEKDEKRSLSNIEIDSEKFISYVKDLPQEKRDQLIQLADEVKVTGQSQSLVNKLISNQKFMNHLNKVGMVSGITMHGMMGKATLASFLNYDYEGVAINLGFIAGGQGFAKVAEAASFKGLKLASEGRLLLGKSLRAASPFLARGTSAFIIYDLVNQVKAFKNGTKEALVGVVGDSIYLGVDSAEIGIEIAEAFEVLEGVSSVTGPIGAVIGAVVFVGTDVYMAVKRVDKIDQLIHLTGKERFVEDLRAFIGMQPEQYIKELMEEKQLYNQLVKQGFEYLKQHSDIQSYVFPIGQKVDLDSTVLLDRKRTDIKWSRVRPDNPDEGQVFCVPQGNYEPAPSYGSYLCKNAIGLSANKTGSHTLISLEEGKDYAKGFLNSPNIFVVNNGSKEYYGGNKDDIFVLQADFVNGYLSGEGGVNTLDITSFAFKEEPLNIQLDIGEIADFSRSNWLKICEMNKIIGRKDKAETITVSCDGCNNNVKLIDGQSGNKEIKDRINIMDDSCNYQMQIIVRSNTVVYNRALKGSFDYVVPLNNRGSAELSFIYGPERFDVNNKFWFAYEPVDIKSIDVKYVNVFNRTEHEVKFNFIKSDKEFNITISYPENPLYMLGNNGEIRIGSKDNLYMLQNSNESAEEIIRNYLPIANRLSKMSFFIQSLLSNETVVIGSGNYEVIHNNPQHKSHLVGNGGENVYVIDSEADKLPEVIIHDIDEESSIDTIDLEDVLKSFK
ncbi:ankyrin repeat domain-containing protein [Wolbachia endosymbiont of Pentalonia nigronervosa]|uniref:ankyrin repeat domain-containing protein n=1 Tax=Wolbachia endosymbiont of Pentalonia nigronervosa TaxID=1301914 RepID=UPI00165FD452|nr:ankyrin repeat domain-containing protein [Wolbachia endosymbiont of Pentalonia nigronervosa]MBD0392011.1 ankyrin repeat domain-containing protein [Wolbachia endosymbiont of Pentalonia nigronervosa]